MRVLELVTARQWRGAEVFATHLSDALAERGHEVLVLGLFPPPAEELAPKLAAAADLPVTTNGRFDVARLDALRAAVTRFRPDVVQANGSQTLKYGAIARRLTGRRWPLVYRNISIASRWVRGPAHRVWGRWLARSLAHVSSVSEESSRDFARTYGVPAHRRSVMRRGILVPDQVDAAGARRQLQELTGMPADARVLVHMGNFSEEKNHGWLVDTFRTIHEADPGVHLVLMGEGVLRAAVAEQVTRLGLQSAVHLLGLRPDAVDLVAGADLLVLPSRIEGLPGVVLEAGAQGVPAVASDVGGMREAIEDGRTGILVPLDDRSAFIEAVTSLLMDDARRACLGQAARAFVRERFSMEATALAFEELYERLLREQRR